MLLNKRYVAAGLLSLVIVSISSLVWPRETTKSLVTKLDRCVLSADADCVWSYVTEPERKRFEISKQQFGSLLRDYIAQEFNSLGPSTMQVASGPLPGESISSRTFKVKGAEVLLSIAAVQGVKGPESPDLVSGLVLQTIDAKWPRLKTDRFTYNQESRAIRAEMATLNKHGIRGFYVFDKTGESFVTWEERLRQIEQKLAILRNRKHG